ncbi:MAG: malate synthase G [Acidimicrobiales bacterium]|nr:malate synthase G [Acidimicrobiales bacterium]
MAQIGSLEIAQPLHDFVESALTPDSGVTPADFWGALEAVLADMGPRNAALLARRDALQDEIDRYLLANRGSHDQADYLTFLRKIGYLEDTPAEVSVATTNVDIEIAGTAGAQLVVPLDNARYALNAANARWGSLYDALYGTDVITDDDGAEAGRGYNPVRGAKVIAWGRAFLDAHAPLASGSHADATGYSVVDGALQVAMGESVTGLADPAQFVGYAGDVADPTNIVLRKHGLHADIRIDRTDNIGKDDAAGVADIDLESAISSIMDCEDSVSAVDADDKVVVYGNWLGLMKGDLVSTFQKGGQTMERRLNGDRTYTAPDGSEIVLQGRACMLVRNVGHHLTTDAVTMNGEPIFETVLDCFVTALAAKHDLLGNSAFRNSRTGSVYIVKPKMHGADEVAWAVELFGRVETALGLEANTLKMGIMDEERRTSLNLAAAIDQARERVVFINTGFLDRTGDEIHTDMDAGPMLKKGAMKGATWLLAYEDANVDTGLAAGMQNRAQIGKGMWAKPSDMAEMLATKSGHPQSGATCAWVPSPTAATLHSTHYFDVNVAARQEEIQGRAPRTVEELTTIPLLEGELTEDEIQTELDNNCQSILGYVVRWVGQGVGCSTVPDIDDVGLMEDLATLRISSQHVANWLHHNLVSADQVREAMQRMAVAVDAQNADDELYEPMATDYTTSIPFQAAVSLVLDGRVQKNGYTEAILRDHRRRQKSASAV